MDDEEEEVEGESSEEKKQYYIKDGDEFVPVSMYSILGRQGEFTSKADRIAAKDAFTAKRALAALARGSLTSADQKLGITLKANVPACKEILTLFKEQQHSKGIKAKSKEISLGFGSST